MPKDGHYPNLLSHDEMSVFTQSAAVAVVACQISDANKQPGTAKQSEVHRIFCNSCDPSVPYPLKRKT
jgi:hypothetical protein